MRRTNRPNVELLEGKTLLSAASAATSGLVGSLTAVATGTGAGTRVVVTLTETNVTDHDVTIDVGPTNDGFVATRDGKAVWASNPGIQPQYLILETVKAHHSITFHATWDGRSNQVNLLDPSKEGPPLSGTFKLSTELDRAAPGVTVTLGNAPKPTHVVPPRPPAHHSH